MMRARASTPERMRKPIRAERPQPELTQTLTNQVTPMETQTGT